MGKVLHNLEGMQIHAWTVLSLATPLRQGKYPIRRYRCRCVCGVERDVTVSSLVKAMEGNTRCGSRSCGCIFELRPYEATYRLLLDVGKRRDWPLSLTYEEFLEFTKIQTCHYCGAEITWYVKHDPAPKYNLDRKDNTVGYTKENLVVCCARCNRAKGNNFTYDEWLQLGAIIESWRAS
jgi:hypothetical protein